MKVYLLLIFFEFAFQSSYSQPGKAIDSLVHILKIAAGDTNRVNTLNALSKRLGQTSKFEEAKKYAGEALTLAGKLDFKKGMAAAYDNTASIYAGQGNYPEALKNHRASLKIKEVIGDKRGMAITYNIIAQINSYQNNYSEALRNLLASVKIREDIGDKKGMAGMYFNIGAIYDNRGNHSEAFKNYLASLQIAEEIGDKQVVAMCYSKIGDVYAAEENSSEALKNYFAALKMRKEIGDKRGAANSCITIGNLYKDASIGKYAEALEYYLDAIKIFEELNDRSSTIDIYFNIGFLYGSKGNYVESIKYHQAALKVSEETRNKSGVAASYGNIGEAYYCQSLAETNPEQRELLLNKALGNYFSCLDGLKKIDNMHGIANAYNDIGEVYFELKNYNKASQFFNDGLTLSKKVRAIENIKKNYWCLAKLDSVTGDYQQALLHYKLYTDYKDSLLNESNSQQLAQMKEQYESEKKDKELKSKQDSLIILETQKEKIQLENEKIQALNGYNQKQLELLVNEKKLQQLQIEKDKADYSVQKAEADKKQEQLIVLNKEKDIQALQVKKQKQAKNYLIAGLVLFAVLSVFVYRNYQTRQQLKLQTLRNKIASDLHDDIGSTLSSISIFSQVAVEDAKEIKPMLQTIGESSRKMLDAMADIVWTINPENDQFDKIILRMRSFAYELLGAKKMEFRFVADKNISDIKLSMEARKNLYLIFKEATNNLVKYSGAERALFSLKGEQGKLVMMIRDEGKGFDSRKETQGNGLRNMQKRAAEIGAVLNIDSVPGNGTTIKLELAV